MRVNDIITESLDEQILDEWSTMHPEIERALKAKGYKHLGSGVDQSAYTEPGTGYVLKIFGTHEKQGFSRDHKMFFLWADFCEKHQDNPFLPRFYGHESFMWADPRDIRKQNRYLMIRTEPLQKSGKIGYPLAMMASYLGRGRSIQQTTEIMKQEEPADWKTLTQSLPGNQLMQFMQTCHDLGKIGKKKGWIWDLHNENIMMRSDGTPVINDPWVVPD